MGLQIQASVARLCACTGDKPEQLYPEARQELRALGYESTLEYAADAAGTVMRETGLLPHINAGTMGLAEVGPPLPALQQCIRAHHAMHPLCYSLTQLISPPAKGRTLPMRRARCCWGDSIASELA